MLISSGLEKQIREIRKAKETGLSFFVYNLNPMKLKIQKLKALLPSTVGIFYAMKANPHVAFLQAALNSDVSGVEIASLGEGRKAIAAGFHPQQIVFTGPGKSPDELTWSVETGIKLVHVESLVEAHRLDEICKKANRKQDILVRVNPNFHIHGAQASFSGDSSKFGIDQMDIFEFLPQILKLSHLNFCGLHVYSASGVLEEEQLLENCKRVFDLAKEIEARNHGVRCATIDFGGGFGIDYLELGRDFEPEIYVTGLRSLIEQYGLQDRSFVLELGRYLAADSGWYCSEILDIKKSVGVKQIVCQGGSHHFRRPVALKINHPTAVVSMAMPELFAGQESVENELTFIGGSLCNSADKLAAEPIHIERAQVGDMFVVGLAGAYGYSMSHLDFLSHNRPAEIVVQF